MLIVISTQHLFIPTVRLFALLANVTQAITVYRPESVICSPAIKVYLSFKQDTPIMCGFDLTGANAHAGDEYLDLEKLVVAALICALTAVSMDRTIECPINFFGVSIASASGR